MEVGNLEMIACFLSHIHIWNMVTHVNDTFLILEEDAVLSTEEMDKIDDILHSMHNETWDIIMLAGRMWHVSHGEPRGFNQYLMQCEQPRACSWFGTRGYLLHPQGARKLLDNIPDMVIQVDAYISLMNSYYEPGFKLFWVKNEIVHGKWLRISTVWDACFICYISPFVSWVILCCIVIILVYLLKKRSTPKA
jgi:GR25 family glycosyltransferase involved in LPS biosynthesis